MNCASCGHANPERAKFCLECGVPVSPRCASCGTELPAAAKFCLECGTPTAARPAEPAGSRKVVTIVFADLVGSTSLHERLDAESARRFMESYYRAMRGAVEAHGGTVTQLLGDGVKAVFGIPRVTEDDAIRAVRAAIEMQRAFRALAEQQITAVGKTGLRVAVNTGEVVANDASEIIGDPVNVAARLQEHGRDGDVVVGDSTQRLVGDRLTLDRMVWTGGPEGAAFENVRIRVVEVDDTGRLRAIILYDVEDRGAAFAEALARFVSGEAAACQGLAAVAEFVGAFSAHDCDRVREVTPPDFVFDDHRTIGMGTLDRERHVASMRAHAELGPGLAADVRRIHTWSRRGLVATIRTHGNVRDGGPFENVSIG